jgi:transcriptional regulator with XRE-family HTH domain
VKKKAVKKRKLIFDEKGLQAFAEHLKTVRAKQGFTQEELSHKSGLALSQIARIETARTNPTLSTVFAIAKALNVELKDLFSFQF